MREIYMVEVDMKLIQKDSKTKSNKVEEKSQRREK